MITSGDRFGRLVALVYIPKRRGVVSHQRWECVCDCGEKVVVDAASLKRGLTSSCGCLRSDRVREANTRHGHARRLEPWSREYRSWGAAKERCFNPDAHNYDLYGGRGITMCARWRDDFAAFLADMGSRPPCTSLDRIDNNGNYEPGNCRWATPKEQRRNQRRVKAVAA